MICPNCRKDNADEYAFCLDCGTRLSATDKTDEYPPSVATIAAPPHRIPKTLPQAIPLETDLFNSGTSEVRRPSKKWLFAAVAAVVLVGLAGGAAAIVYFTAPLPTAEKLPDHLGLFAIDPITASLNEIRKNEFANLRDARENILKDPMQTSVGAGTEFILYADSSEIKIDDLKLVRVDSITDQGAVKHLDYQASIIGDRPAMKRLRLGTPLAAGRYAFALFDGYFEDGKHKVWSFEVKGQPGSVNQSERDMTVTLKPKDVKPAATPTANTSVEAKSPLNELPAGAKVAYCNATDVTVRVSPNLKARKINQLRRGQKIFVISYSDNYDSWNGMQSNWAYIQTENGKRGWVFTPFISN